MIGNRLSLLIIDLLAVPLPTEAADSTRTITIADAKAIATPAARERLRYLASCALGESTALVGEADGTRYPFPGSIGLAKGWADRALTVSERRWVSACMLARMNAFGTRVVLSLRADRPDIPALHAGPDEAATFAHHEGGFFGDLFSQTPVAFVCVGPNKAHRVAAERALHRVCTHPLADNSDRSRCDLRIIEGCDAPIAVDGTVWTEIIHVYLPASTAAER